MPVPSALKVTVVDGATVLRMPWRTVVPLVTGPVAPCRVPVWPPRWSVPGDGPRVRLTAWVWRSPSVFPWP